MKVTRSGLKAPPGKVFGKSYDLVDGKVVSQPPNFYLQGQRAFTKTWESWHDYCIDRQTVGPDFMFLSGLWAEGIHGQEIGYDDAALTRSKKHVTHQPIPSVASVDIDFKTLDETQGLASTPRPKLKTADDVRKALLLLAPSLEGVGLFIYKSSLGGITLPDGSPRKETDNWRVDVHVADGTIIPALLEYIHARCFALNKAAYAYISNAQEGPPATLMRSLADRALKVAPQPDFAAPSLSGGLAQNRDWTVFEGEPLNAAPTLTPDEIEAALETEERLRSQLEPTRSKLADAVFEKIVKRKIAAGKTEAEATAETKARFEGRILYDDDVLFDREGNQTTAGALRDSMTQGMAPIAMPDPDRDYAYGATTAVARWGQHDASPTIYSYATGGATFVFARDVEVRRDSRGRYVGSNVYEMNAEPEIEGDNAASRAKIETALWDFLPRVAAYDDLSGNPAPVLVLKGDPGLGKSETSRHVVYGCGLTRFLGDILFQPPTLALAEEAEAHAKSIGFKNTHTTRGRSAADPEAPGQQMCVRAPLAERLAKMGGNVKAGMCERWMPDGENEFCPDHAPCRAIHQHDHLPTGPIFRTASHGYLTTPDPSGRKVALTIMDEKVWGQFASVKDIKPADWVGPRRFVIGEGAATAKATQNAAKDVLAALRDGESPVLFPADLCRQFAEAEATPTALDVSPQSSTSTIAESLARLEDGNAHNQNFALLWEVLADCAERGLKTTERVRLAKLPDDQEVIRVTHLQMPDQQMPNPARKLSLAPLCTLLQGRGFEVPQPAGLVQCFQTFSARTASNKETKLTRITIHPAFTDAGEGGARCRVYHSAKGLTFWAKSLCETTVKAIRKIDSKSQSAQAFDIADLADGCVEHLEELLKGARE